MRDDLLDAYAAIDWARAQIPAVEQEIKAWVEAPAYLLVEEPNLQMQKKFFKLQINRRLSGTLNAGVGAIINSARTSLDLLASALCYRNGKAPSRERHFPIYYSVLDFIDPLKTAERKKWLSASDLQIIEALKPYSGGNDLLFALHELDILRKHERLLKVTLRPSGFYVDPRAYREGLEFPHIWPGFDDGTVIAWTHIDAQHCEFQIPAEITFNETLTGLSEPVIATLRQFTGMANSIIQSFE